MKKDLITTNPKSMYNEKAGTSKAQCENSINIDSKEYEHMYELAHQ